MSKQEAQRLLQGALADEDLLAQLQEKSIEEATETAHGLGYDATAEEIADEFEEYRKTKASEEPIEMLEEELDQVAGGIFFGPAETAPDGHEMGCFWTWHGKKWQHENDVWCRRDYFCYTKWDECVGRGRTNQ